MLSLIFAMLCSASIALLFKVSESGKYNRSRVTTVNYIAAFSISMLLFVLRSQSAGIRLDSIFVGVNWPVVMGIGLPAGLCFFGSFVLYQQSVKDNGASLSAMAGKMGILLPMIASILFWKEWPTAYQTIGIALAISAILYINSSPSSHQKIKASLILLFLIGGLGEFTNKLFQVYGQSSDQSLFLFVVFATACLLSLIYTLKQAIVPGSSLKKDILMGLAIGIPNLFSSHFLIRALNTMAAAIAFPAFSASTILIVALLSRILFGEKLNRRSMIGLSMTIVALLLIF